MDDKSLGAFSLVLHTHIPYCRLAGMWPHGEEWIHEALAETYLPLLNALYDLRAEGVATRLTVSLTPVLVEQLADETVCAHFLDYLQGELAAAEGDLQRAAAEHLPEIGRLAQYYVKVYTGLRDSFVDRYHRDVVGAFRQLQDEGRVELSTSAATHGYLPLLGRDSSIYGQIRAGRESYVRHFGRQPKAIWLPECAYRPTSREGDVERPAIEEFLAAQGYEVFFVESDAIEGEPSGTVRRPLGPDGYEAAQRRWITTGNVATSHKSKLGTTFKTYYAQGSDRLVTPPVYVIARNNRTSMQVWSADMGYPGDPAYREFHRKDPNSGLQYWRVTGPKVELGEKDYYDPEVAQTRVTSHAADYARLVVEQVLDYAERTGGYGLVSSHYDTELFGHWWFEGTDWIKQVLRLLAADGRIALTTASGFVAQHASGEAVKLPEGSWGAGGDHWTWDNDEVHWMWAPIHAAEERMEELVARYPAPSDEERTVLNQAARELLLLQSSDWPFLATTGQAKEYALERFSSHLDRFNELASVLDTGVGSALAARAQELWEADKVFPTIDYRWFAARQGRAT